MTSRCIDIMGIEHALHLMMEPLRRAGQLAERLQPQIHAQERVEKGGTTAAASALTAADLLLEDLIGVAVLERFEDASFYGEEHERDRISAFIPDGKRYRILLDPINGTLFYRDGLGIYECILTICEVLRNGALEQLGVLIYHPRQDRMTYAFRNPLWQGACRTRLFKSHERDATLESFSRVALSPNPSRVIYLGSELEGQREAIRQAGFNPIIVTKDYMLDGSWSHTLSNILYGGAAGYWNKRAQIIDSGAIGFALGCIADGAVVYGYFNPDTLRFNDLLMFVTEEAQELLMRLYCAQK